MPTPDLPGGPRPAATVALLRDGAAGVEVYVQRRAAGVAMGGVWVFPGGRIDPADGAEGLDAHWAGPAPAWWAGRMGSGVELARGAVAAACRETLEEAGVLLADRPLAPEAVAEARAGLLAGLGLAEVLGRLGVRLDTGLLRYWAHFVTPAGEPRRYDTRFFVAALPPGAAVAPHGLEADAERWVAPALGDGELAPLLLPPTRLTLRSLAGFERVELALWAGLARDVPRVEPVLDGDDIVMEDGERFPCAVRLLHGQGPAG